MSNHPNRSRTCRPREHLRAAGQLYPDAWKQFGDFRARQVRDLTPWPEWCYCPLAGAYAVVSGGGTNRVPLTQMEDVGRLGALAAWRVGQGVYRFDPALYEALIATPVTGDLPCEVLFRLPEWCVYVETPDMAWANGALHGFFAHLESDANTGREELRLLLDSENALQPLALHLGAWPLRDALTNAAKLGKMNAAERGWASPSITDDAVAALVAALEPLLSLLLYLCADNPEIGDGTARPERPKPKKTKKGWRLFPPDQPHTWDVGVRLGAALRRARSLSPESAQDAEPGTHASPRAHIRRAHWHTFRRGAGRAETVLRWLPPIPVNVDDPDALPATVRPVKKA